MRRRRIRASLLAGAIFIFLGASNPAWAAIWHVDDNGAYDPGPGDLTVSDPLEDGSIDHPFDSIQEAINGAGMGNMITVFPGVYI